MLSQRKELNFKGQNIYVGIDVHKKSWSVAVLSESLLLKKFSQDPHPEALHKFLVANYPGAVYHSVYEAGFCGFWIHYKFTALGFKNIVVNPGDVPTMSKEKLSKTDAVDCYKLARGLRAGDLQGIYVPEAENLEIRSLIRLRSSIVKDSTREKNRIKSLLHFYGIHIPEQFSSTQSYWSRRFVKWLQEIEFSTEYGRKTLDMYLDKYLYLRGLLLKETKSIRDLSRSEAFKEPLRLLMSVPGVGITIGTSLLTEIDNISRFRNADQLAAYVGLIPMCHSSGEKEYNGDITVRKQATLRYSIIEASWKAISKDPVMTMAYEQYCKRMNANKAIVKIARKLVNRIFFVLKRKQEYVPCIV